MDASIRREVAPTRRFGAGDLDRPPPTPGCGVAALLLDGQINGERRRDRLAGA